MKNLQTLDKRILALRIVFIILSVAVTLFIFSNSLQKATDSSKQSSQVVDAVQEVVGVIAPESPIATATGEDYERLHNVIRKIAHFAEFALLGALLCGTYFSFTVNKKGVYIPMVVLSAVACTDESLQLFVQGRGASLADILLDCFGGACGILFAFLLFLAIHKIIEKRRNQL